MKPSFLSKSEKTVSIAAINFPLEVRIDVERALSEDVGTGDVTAALLPAQQMATATIICRERAVICGRPWVDEVLRQVAPTAVARWFNEDGQHCDPGQTIVEISGLARELLTAERVCLNFLQTLSAVATKTARYVKAIEGTRAVVLDTRKTIPGLRMAQKYAVRCGGGSNHRMGLYDAILIKENHIAAAGSVTAALLNAQTLVAEQAARHGRDIGIQIEVETLEQLREAFAAGATSILLDNFDEGLMRQAVAISHEMTGGHALLEASGGVTLAQLRGIAATGVDRISVGKLTKDVSAVDFSMRVLGKVAA